MAAKKPCRSKCSDNQSTLNDDVCMSALFYRMLAMRMKKKIMKTPKVGGFGSLVKNYCRSVKKLDLALGDINDKKIPVLHLPWWMLILDEKSAISRLLFKLTFFFGSDILFGKIVVYCGFIYELSGNKKFGLTSILPSCGVHSPDVTRLLVWWTVLDLLDLNLLI